MRRKSVIVVALIAAVEILTVIVPRAANVAIAVKVDVVNPSHG